MKNIMLVVLTLCFQAACTPAAASQQTTVYFDAHGQAGESAVMGGYYRTVLDRLPDGTYRVQDFYSDRRQRSSPYVLEAAQLNRWQTGCGHTVYGADGRALQRECSDTR